MASEPATVGMVAYLTEAVVGIFVIGGLSILAYEGVRRLRNKRRRRAAESGGEPRGALPASDKKEN